MAEFLRVDHPEFAEAYRAAVLSLVHGERVELDHPGLMAHSLAAAAVDLDVISDNATDETLHERLAASTARAAELGVVDVPSLFRHGPVLRVVTTAAVLHGSAIRRLEVIAAMLDDDGLWQLGKP